MNAAAYVESCAARGVILWRDGEALRYKAPPGVLTPAVLEKLRQAKPKILPVLPDAPPVPSISGALPVSQSKDESSDFCLVSTPSVSSETTHASDSASSWRTPERIAWEKLIDAVASGRKLVFWPTHNEDGIELKVQISPGVTTEEPERYFPLAYQRYCRIWHIAETATGEQKKRAERDREILFADLLRVLEQAEDLPAADTDPYPGGTEGCRTADALALYPSWVIRQCERIRRGDVPLPALSAATIASLSALVLPTSIEPLPALTEDSPTLGTTCSSASDQEK
jgi:hypothetical protein